MGVAFVHYGFNEGSGMMALNEGAGSPNYNGSFHYDLAGMETGYNSTIKKLGSCSAFTYGLEAVGSRSQLEIPVGALNFSSGCCSYTAWVRIPSKTGIFFSHGTSAGTNQRCYIGGNGSFYWGIGFGTQSYSKDPDKITLVASGEWVHIGVVISGGSPQASIYLYVNGSYDHGTTKNYFTAVGTLGFSNYIGNDFTTRGYIDDFRYFNGRCIGLEEIKQIFNKGSGTEMEAVQINGERPEFIDGLNVSLIKKFDGV